MNSKDLKDLREDLIGGSLGESPTSSDKFPTEGIFLKIGGVKIEIGGSLTSPYFFYFGEKVILLK